MYRSSFAAITQFINKTFPSITTIYLNSKPAGYTRPSFFVQLLKGSSEAMNRDIYQNQVFWQIVYCATQDANGNMDSQEQMNITEQMQQYLMETMTLTAPDGTQYQLLSLDVEYRDKEICCTVGLVTLNTRPETQYDLMQTINNVYKEG